MAVGRRGSPPAKRALVDRGPAMHSLTAVVAYLRCRRFRKQESLAQLLRATREQRQLAIAKLEGRRAAAGLKLDPLAVQARNTVSTTLARIVREAGLDTGPNWHSNALRPEIVQGFHEVLSHLPGHRRCDYLEIGSCQGASMGLIALILRELGKTGRLVSIDPYLEPGYLEDDGFVPGLKKELRYGSEIMAVAQRLYAELIVPVEVMRKTSEDGILDLRAEGVQFDLVYIDGNHGGFHPMCDFVLSRAVSRPGAIIILDDHMYPDVAAVKRQADKYSEKIYENWKIAAYKF